MTRTRPDKSLTAWMGWPLLLAGCALLLGGCETLVSGTGRGHADLRAANAAFLARLEELETLASGDRAAQARLLEDRRAAFEKSPGVATGLHYGLLLSIPGLPGHDPRTARALIARAIESGEGLAPAERALALAALPELDARLSLEEDSRRLAAEIVTLRDGAAAANKAAARRLQAELDENARLRRALEEARSKLQKLAALEKAAALGQPAPEDRKP